MPDEARSCERHIHAEEHISQRPPTTHTPTVRSAPGVGLIEQFLLDDMQLRNESWVWLPFDRSREARAALKNLSASLIGTFIERVTEGDVFHKPDDDTQRHIFVLTGMAWAWMIENPAQETVRFGQRRLVEDLFEGYWENRACCHSVQPGQLSSARGRAQMIVATLTPSTTQQPTGLQSGRPKRDSSATT